MLSIENSNLSVDDIYFFLENPHAVKLNSLLRKKIILSYERSQKIAKNTKPVYGINTGVGPLCTKRITSKETKSLQRNLLLSHSVGVGAVSYTHLRAHETKANLVCRLLLEKKKKKNTTYHATF